MARWTLALWDLAGKIREQPIWAMLGGSNRIRAYAFPPGCTRPRRDGRRFARRAIALGYPALKVRFGRPDVADDLAVISAVRDAVGSRLALMVDCNQGWRMPWDIRPAWHLDRATEVAARLAAEDVYWMEEPLHRADYDGMAELRR